MAHLKNKTSVIHNAISEDKININKGQNKKYFALFNRKTSLRRLWWLFPSRKYIHKIRGHYGDQYYTDLADSNISVNIHFTSKNLDDFETGIFEAMASGCVVVSEKLDPKTTPNPLSQNEIIDLPILKVNENDLINIKNGELMNNNLFKTKETYILEYDGNVVATYVPFNEKYFKPDKVII